MDAERAERAKRRLSMRSAEVGGNLPRKPKFDGEELTGEAREQAEAKLTEEEMSQQGSNEENKSDGMASKDKEASEEDSGVMLRLQSLEKKHEALEQRLTKVEEDSRTMISFQ
eukprot:10851826-Karenia_brevis.AAC.1